MTNYTNSPIKVLIVEDMPQVAEGIKLTLEETLSVDVRIETSFDRALDVLRPSRSFEAVILDLFLGNPYDLANREGDKVWEQIWLRKLMPVIIYTANDTGIETLIPKNNPFVACFTKGPNKDLEVAQYLAALQPHILALRQVEEEFDRAIHSVLKYTSPLIWDTTGEDHQLQSDLLVRSARRRLAAMMDFDTSSTNEKLQSWEQYIYPPIGDNLLMGDVIRERSSDPNNPASYSIVLTPSCDMQMRNGKCKVEFVLMAKCTAIDNYIAHVRSAFNVKSGDIPTRLPRYLSEPHQGGLVPLPEYPSLLPHMAANLRDLNLISVANITLHADDMRPYERVVSVDSPFREYIGWAYLQIAGRPGVPERDLDSWTSRIFMDRTNRP